MNLRDKLRAVGGTGGSPRPAGEVSTDCRHFAVYRPAEEFPGAYDLSAETLRMMRDRDALGSAHKHKLIIFYFSQPFINVIKSIFVSGVINNKTTFSPFVIYCCN